MRPYLSYRSHNRHAQGLPSECEANAVAIVRKRVTSLGWSDAKEASRSDEAVARLT